MSQLLKRNRLPENPTVKDINQFKKKINWGEIPSFFHLIATAVGEAEGFVSYGFNNAYSKIINRRNWNYEILGIPEDIDLDTIDHIEHIEPINKPRICLFHIFNVHGYELIALPYVKHITIDEYRKDDPEMEFSIWDPSEMKSLVRIAQLHKFIAMIMRSGDDADMALIRHADYVVNKIIEHLKQNVDVVEIKGMTIKDAFVIQTEHPEIAPEEVLRQQISPEDLK